MSICISTVVQAPPNRNPKIPDDVKVIPIQPAALSVGFALDCVYTFPEGLDNDRLIEAIKATVAIWPVAAGRFVKIQPENKFDPDHGIELSNSPIPFDTQTLELDRPFSTDALIVPSTGRFITPLPDKFFVPGSGAPLLTVRHTTLIPSGRSVLGLNFDHVIFDGSSACRFSHHLSHFYINGPDTKIPLVEYPTFGSHIQFPEFPPPEQAINKAKAIHVLKPVTHEEGDRLANEDISAHTMVNMVISGEEMEKMKKEVTERLDVKDTISDQDILSGWFTHLMERVTGPVNQMVYIINYRGMGGPCPPEMKTFCGNGVAFWQFPLGASDTTDPAARAAVIATACRRELKGLYEDKAKLSDWLAGTAYLLGESAKDGKTYTTILPQGYVYINSNLRFDWRPPFGFHRDAVRYHTACVLGPCCRVFEANPKYNDIAVSSPDKARATLPYASGIELTTRVPHGWGEEKLREVLAADRARWAAM